MIKPILVFVLSALMFCACNKDQVSRASSNIVTDDGSVLFEELLLLVNVQKEDSSYVVAASVDSISIYVNNDFWANVSSVQLDTTKIVKSVNGNRFTTNRKVNYLVQTTKQVGIPNFVVAGDYAQFINADVTLKPGEYACFIASFWLADNNGNSQQYHPMDYTIFRVEPNDRSAFVGEITLIIE